MPAVTVEVIDAQVPRSAPVSTDTLFVTAESDRGAPGVAHEFTSMDALTATAGNGIGAGALLHDAKWYFAQGGSRLIFSRVLGPAPVKATGNAFDAAGSVAPGDVALVITAKSAGQWANNLTFQIEVTGTDFVIVVADGGFVVERSPTLADRAGAVDWAADTSRHVDIALGASAEDPRAQGPTALAAGTDDRTNITDTQRAAAYAAFTADLGPGQVIEPGVTSTVARARLSAHAAANNRVALPDGQDTALKATLTAAADAARVNGRYGQLLAPWAVVPGDAPGTTRQVPYSYIQAGVIARNDNAGQSPNRAAAGENGKPRGLVGLTQTYSDADYAELDAAGVTVARETYGQIALEGVKTLADPDTDPLWDQFQSSRLMMRLRALAYAVAWRARFDEIDGKGYVFSQLRTDLINEVCQPYFTARSLYGESPEEAFRVDTGAQVNTPESIAARQIKAAMAVRPSGAAEFVTIQIVRTAITQPV